MQEAMLECIKIIQGSRFQQQNRLPENSCWYGFVKWPTPFSASKANYWNIDT
jgi:hypothetical protein